MSQEDPDSPAPAVLVTGGGKRLGAAIVRRFARDGWHCVIHCRDSVTEAAALKGEIEKVGGSASVVRFDLADRVAVAAGLAAAFADTPGLSVLVNSASIFEYDDVAAPDWEVWSRSLSINSFGPILLSAEFHARLGGDATGCIVNLLDQKLMNLNPDYFSYTVAKAALQTASQIMARAFAPKTRVVNVAPGLVLPSADQTEAEFAVSSAMNILQRRTSVAEVVDGIYYVATSRYATGQTLFIDSGQSLVTQDRDVMFLVREQEKR